MGDAEMSTLYLASRFERQAELRVYAALLREVGHTVTSRWLEHDGPAVGESPARCAGQDMIDIDLADWFVLFTDLEIGRGGKDFEMGWALHHGLKLLLVGPRVHVFHYLPAIVHYETVTEFMAAMGVR
jgi:hypothetical protein